MSNQLKHSGEFMLTTTDNPFNPFTQFVEWLAFDTGAGYNTSGLLARVAISSNELSEADQSLVIQQAIDEIVTENILGIYKKVSKDSFDEKLAHRISLSEDS